MARGKRRGGEQAEARGLGMALVSFTIGEGPVVTWPDLAEEAEVLTVLQPDARPRLLALAPASGGTRGARAFRLLEAGSVAVTDGLRFVGTFTRAGRLVAVFEEPPGRGEDGRAPWEREP